MMPKPHGSPQKGHSNSIKTRVLRIPKYLEAKPILTHILTIIKLQRA
jgi:hypothetical protein